MVFTLLNPMKPLFYAPCRSRFSSFFPKLYFFLMLLKVKGTFLQKRGGKHYYPNTIHLKLFHPDYQNEILSGKFSVQLELSNGFLYRVIRRLKISVFKNHPKRELVVWAHCFFACRQSTLYAEANPRSWATNREQSPDSSLSSP